MSHTISKRKVVLGTVSGLIVSALAVGAFHPSRKVSASAKAIVPTVLVVPVEQKNLPVVGESIGTLDGLVNADVRAQVTGYIQAQGYKEGSFVKKGQLLFQIDPRPFQAALDLAEGQLEQAKAALANAQAVQGRTELDVKRYTPLAREQAASQQDLDNAVQNNLAALASVETAKSQIKTSEAAVETARINLGFTRLTAPIDGIAGQAQLQVGALVSPATGTITSISTVDPIKVYFTLSESEYLAWRKRFPSESERQTADKALRLQLSLADGTIYEHEGKFDFADRQVSEGTGAIRIAGLFPNPDNILRPGGFGRVRAVVNTRSQGLLVPERAVSELQGSYQVAVVGAGNKVAFRPVNVGETFGSERVITAGLSPGERVVVEGTQKVRPGIQVNPLPFSPIKEK